VELDLEGTLENYSFKKNYVQWDKSGKGYNSQDQRAFYSDNKHGTVPKSRTITKCKVFYKDVNKKSYRLKCLGLNEIEVLQTLPYNYTLLQDGFSLNKSTEAIGNGWCVNVIAHILKGIKKKTIGFGG